MNQLSSSTVQDPARLAALHGYEILDTPPEPGFDDVVALALEVCGARSALVSLVATDRQWFKARVGFEACETPIGQSVCVHALAQHDLLVIPDLAADERTRDNSLVTGVPHLRFYAGMPLVTVLGEVLGTLCVLDGEPRPDGMSRGQEASLRALGRQVMTLIEMRGAVASRDEAMARERRSGDDHLVSALANEREDRRSTDAADRATAAREAGRIGIFEVDVETDLLKCSAEMCRIYGLTARPSYPASRFADLTVDADCALAPSPMNGSAFSSVEGRIRRADDGAVRWIARRSDFVRDEAGRPIRFTGTVADVTDRKLGDRRQSALLALGDELRDATTTAAIAVAASRLVGATLDASRVGYAVVDQAAGTFTVELDWVAPNVRRVAGAYPLATFANTIGRIRDGTALDVADVAAADWLGEEVKTYAAIGVRAQIVAPLLQRGRLVGSLFVHGAEPRAWSRDEVDFARAVADRTHAAFAKVRAEEDQRVLNQELSHRLKNTLAMVQAIATQTLRGVAERSAVDAFKPRLMALGQAHDVLVQESWASAPVRGVVDGTLALHADPSRFDIDGPDLNLAPKSVLSLTLLLHELATNAVKYGALSAEGGAVALAWTVDRTGDAPAFVVTWLERGGPPAAEPERRGFGSRLIGMGLTGTGDVNLRYEVGGLKARFSAPLSIVTET